MICAILFNLFEGESSYRLINLMIEKLYCNFIRLFFLHSIDLSKKNWVKAINSSIEAENNFLVWGDPFPAFLRNGRSKIPETFRVDRSWVGEKKLSWAQICQTSSSWTSRDPKVKKFAKIGTLLNHLSLKLKLEKNIFILYYGFFKYELIYTNVWSRFMTKVLFLLYTLNVTYMQWWKSVCKLSKPMKQKQKHSLLIHLHNIPYHH